MTAMLEPLQTSGPEAERRELVAFRIGSQEFCVDIMSIREIRGWAVATPLPRAPDLRGAVLPIVDLSSRLGLAPTDPGSRHVVIVAQIGRQIVGLLVDAVSDILTVHEAEIQPTPEVGSDLVRRFVRGLLAIDGRMISLISLDRVHPDDEAQAA